MKTVMSGVLGVIVVLATVLAPRAHAADVSEVIADHMSVARSYEEQAKWQEALIVAHKQMKKEYGDRFSITGSAPQLKKIEEMEKHCDAIIKETQEARDELLEFAKWHRMRAAELEGW